ncbi:MAG: hypothetical protein R3F31_01755 [Verrucomicrobiales bacterium]
MSLFNDEFSHRDSGNLDDLTGESEELSFLNDPRRISLPARQRWPMRELLFRRLKSGCAH